jgi:hypothetical protein
MVLLTRAGVFRPWKRVNMTQKSLPTHPFALANFLHHSLGPQQHSYVFGCHFLEVKMLKKSILVGRMGDVKNNSEHV